jgi:hypothetical protein
VEEEVVVVVDMEVAETVEDMAEEVEVIEVDNLIDLVIHHL